MKTILLPLALILALSHAAIAGTAADVLNASDAMHAALSADDHAAAIRSAKDLEKIASSIAENASGSTTTRFERIAAAAAEMARTADLAAARRGFGTVSREIVALVASDVALQDGRSLYACPMTEGYGEWVQKSGTTANPYFGASMLTCGTRKQWR